MDSRFRFGGLRTDDIGVRNKGELDYCKVNKYSEPAFHQWQGVGLPQCYLVCHFGQRSPTCSVLKDVAPLRIVKSGICFGAKKHRLLTRLGFECQASYKV